MRTRATTMLLVTGLLVTACGPDIPLDLNVRSVAVTVPRLVTPAIEYVDPPATPPPVSLPPPIRVRQVPPPPPPPPPPPTPAPEPPPPPACPDAGPFDVPELPANPIVDSIPAEATFEQQAEVTAGGEGQQQVAGPVEVVVTALESTTSSVGQQLDAWAVQRTDPTTGGTSVEVYRLVHPHSSPLATSPGVYLTGMGWQDDIRGELTFDAVGDGLWLLPSPVVFAAEDGVQYVGSATDPDTLTTLAVVRNVTGRKRVDACGDLIDTYTVAMTGTLTSNDAQYQVDWTIQLATPYGALDVEQTLALTTPGVGFSWIRTTRNVDLPKVPA